MSSRKPLKVSGLLQSGKVVVNPDIEPITDFGTLGLDEKADPVPLPDSDVNGLPLSLVDDSPFQPRIMYDPAEIDNLAHSLAAAGIEDAITVRQVGARYELISGHRRVRAARSLGWTTISARIVAKDDRQAELATMVQNEARIDLTDYERGKLYQSALNAGFGKTQTDIANLFGTVQGRVSKCLAMLRLPSPFIGMLDDKPDLFGAACSETILLLLKEYPKEQPLIEEAVQRIVKENADQKSVRQWVLQMLKQRNIQAEPRPRAVVTNRAGKEIFVSRRSGREITIQIKASDRDVKEVEEFLLEALRKNAESEKS